MQVKMMWFSKLPLPMFQRFRGYQSTSKFVAWQRMAGVATLALLMVAFFGTNAFAKSVPVKNDGMSLTQQEGTPVGVDTGVVVVAIDEEGPAALAGIVRGDILLTAAGEPIDSAATLYGIVIGSQPGDELTLEVQHGDELRTINVPLGQQGERTYLGVQVVDPPGVPVAVEVPAPVQAAEPTVTLEVVTITVAEDGSQSVTGQGTAQAEIVVPTPGLIVAEVMVDGPAAMAGVAAGDLIIAVDRQPVATADDMINALKGHTPGEVALLTVQKGGPVGAVITEIPVALGAAPDDPARAYLGIQFVAAPSQATIEMLPPGVGFAAPAMPVPPPVPASPETIMGYSYPGAYGSGCGTQIFQYFYPPMGQGAPISAVPFTDLPYSVQPFSAPLPPMVLARPVGPAAPFFIYHSEVNPEIYSSGYTSAYTPGYSYGATGTSGENVIYFQAAPVVEAYPATPVQGTTQQDVVIVRGAQAQPAWTVALPPMAATSVAGVATGVMQKDVVIVQGQAQPAWGATMPLPSVGAVTTVQAVPAWTTALPPVTTEPTEVMQGISVQLLPDGATIQSVPAQVIPYDPAASGVAVPQMAQPATPVPVASDDWF